MKCLEMSATLKAFAALIKEDSSGDLSRLANVFARAPNETVVARLKHLPDRFVLPSSLKLSLGSICDALASCGAAKPCADFSAIAAKFDYSGLGWGGAYDGLLESLLTKKTKLPKARVAYLVDADVVAKYANDLAKAVDYPETFQHIILRLKDPKAVPTPLLIEVGRRHLSNAKTYKGRKAVLDDIERRQKEDLIDVARSRAVKRA